MNVLVDTSVWVSHFRQRNEHLVTLLEGGAVMCHPFVVVEVACGTPPSRQDVIRLLGRLDATPVATPAEVLALIERRALYGRGCGFVDASLLASVLLQPGTRLWTEDRRLAAIAVELGVGHRPTLHPPDP